MQLFPIDLKSPQYFNKQDIEKTKKKKKMGLDFRLWTSRPGEPHHIGKLWPQPRKESNKHFTIKKILIFFTGLPRRWLPEDIAARWCYRLPIKNLTPHYNSQICVTFHFISYGEGIQMCTRAISVQERCKLTADS